MKEFEIRCREAIAFEMESFRKTKGSISHIARRADLSGSTVSKLVYGETKWPRFSTIYKLLKVFNYDLALIRDGIIVEEKTTKKKLKVVK
jgi:transcriptional regulator with XRE-family HTH domain